MQDTGGQEELDRLRPQQYPDTDVAVMVFEKARPDSLDNVQDKWIAEIRHFLPDVPLIIVGNKKDLEHDPKIIAELGKTSQHPVTYAEVCPREQTGPFEFAALYAFLRMAQTKPQNVLKRLFSCKT
ncbi:P-loop containing nucleoside triphosphate hydrolase protein [Dactylonectria macrodidyma]|uniref:P-loop containing nucleoside triphosphate hydrolase protein n=1 Tax=Dactylonectria macrodidyma TaxID=307937 RepID=A0A9P9IK00_9HYPO|nr:P-loop containing nucleoside triphosphate hydrolase protein [Dactylonectria macrodidyma]